MTSDTTQLPVSALEGIGPATATELESIAVFTVADLFRASEQALDGATSASLETARRWRAMAGFVEIEGVDHQLAEALADGGLTSVEQVRSRTADQLTTLFTAAKDASKIPEVPTIETVYGILLDATVLALTGSMNGTVRDEAGDPIEGVTVRIGGGEWTTDARGRFRATRITLDPSNQLVLDKEGFETLVFVNPPILTDDATIAVEVFTLEHATQIDEDDDETPSEHAGELCEYEGDLLPPLSPNAMTTRAMGDAPLRDGDVLVVHKEYGGGDDVKLASKFLRYESGRYYVLHWRVAKSDLPNGASAKDMFRYRDGAFHKIVKSGATPHRLRMLAALRRVRATATGSAMPSSRAEIDQAIAHRKQLLLNEL